MSQETQKFLEEFEVPGYEVWRKAAEDTLGGAPFEKKLITKTYENIDLKPIYHKTEVANLEYLTESLPGEFPFNRGANRGGYKAKEWGVAQIINYPLPELFNTAIKYDLERGQTAINVNLNSEYIYSGKNVAKDAFVCGGLAIANLNDFEKAFNGVDLNKVPVYFRPNTFGFELAAIFAAFCQNNKIDMNEVNVNFGLDPIRELIVKGESKVSLAKMFDDAALLINWAKDNAKKAKVISIDAEIYQNAGANAGQELGYSIAVAIYYIKELVRRGVNIDDATKAIGFNYAVGARFFMEIAKIRAARVLFAKVAKEFGASEDSQNTAIYANTSELNKTKFDPNVNMLRGTAEAVSAVLGGCDALNVAPYDEMLGLASDFSRRVARNMQAVIKDEAHFVDTIDPVAGSWYIDALTDELARKAWEDLRAVEAKGGIIAALEAGFINSEIGAVVSKRKANLSARRETVLGTNKYPNLNEKPVENFTTVSDSDIQAFLSNSAKTNDTEAKLKEYRRVFSAEKNNLFVAAVNAVLAGASINDMITGVDTCETIKISPLVPFRNAEMFEQLRLASDNFKAKNGHGPQVCLVNFGKLKEYKGRNDFSSDFFQVGGFEIVSSEGFENAEAACANILATDYPVYVLCSTDDKYPEVVPAFASALKAAKPKARLVLAGLPVDYVEAFKTAGVDEFIHVKANIYDMLLNTLKEIGVL